MHLPGRKTWPGRQAKNAWMAIFFRSIVPTVCMIYVVSAARVTGVTVDPDIAAWTAAGCRAGFVCPDFTNGVMVVSFYTYAPQLRYTTTTSCTNCQVACTASSTCVGYTDATLLHLTQGTVQVAVGVANARCGSPTYPCPPQTLTFEVADVTTSNGQVLTWFHETSLTSMAMLNNTISMTVVANSPFATIAIPAFQQQFMHQPGRVFDQIVFAIVGICGSTALIGIGVLFYFMHLKKKV